MFNKPSQLITTAPLLLDAGVCSSALCRDVFTLADLKDDETETPVVGKKMEHLAICNYSRVFGYNGTGYNINFNVILLLLLMQENKLAVTWTTL